MGIKNSSKYHKLTYEKSKTTNQETTPEKGETVRTVINLWCQTLVPKISQELTESTQVSFPIYKQTHDNIRLDFQESYLLYLKEELQIKNLME